MPTKKGFKKHVVDQLNSYELIDCLRSGTTNETIAERCNLSTTTVSNYLNFKLLNQRFDTLCDIAISGFRLSLEETELFLNCFNFTIINSRSEEARCLIDRIKMTSFLGDEKVDLKTKNERKSAILSFLVDNPTARQSEIAVALKISRATVNRIVAELKKDGKIKNKGSNKNPNWIFK